jgi:peptidyl-tRNA hydrolase
MNILRKIVTPSSLKMAIIVRNDLKLTKGKIASQCAHAAVSCYQRASQEDPEKLHLWLKVGQPKIVLKVDNLDELERIYQQAKEAKVTAEIIFDAGRTQIPSGTATSVGLGPDFSEKIDAIVRTLKLL